MIVNKNDIIKLNPPGAYYRALEVGQDAIKGRFAKLEEVRETAAGYEDAPGHGMTVLTEKIAKNISVVDRLPEPVPDLRDFSVQDGELLYKLENLWESDARTVTSVIAAVSGGAIVSVKDGDTETLSMFDIEKMETTDIHKGGKKYKKLLQKEQSLLVLCTAGNGGRYPLLFEGDFQESVWPHRRHEDTVRPQRKVRSGDDLRGTFRKRDKDPCYQASDKMARRRPAPKDGDRECRLQGNTQKGLPPAERRWIRICIRHRQGYRLFSLPQRNSP